MKVSTQVITDEGHAGDEEFYYYESTNHLGTGMLKAL